MSYKIVYEPEKTLQFPTATTMVQNYGKWVLIAVSILTVAIFAWFGSSIRNYLIPGDPEQTKEAFQEMMVDIREGETVTEAFSTFCKEILDSDA